MKKIIKRITLGTVIAIGLIIFLAAAFIGVLTIAEYRPAAIEKLEIRRHEAEPQALPRPSTGIPFSVLTWNIGYASLDASQDFFMDGGNGVRPATDENVKRNLAGIMDFLAEAEPDLALIQEADIRSKRSYNVNQRDYLTRHYDGTSAFAHNFRSIFVPIPFPEFIGQVSSGLLTLSRFETAEALRMSLPNPFSWPLRVANLKRCLLLTRIPLEDSAAELVIVNLHLEAYDSSGGREAQTQALLNILNREYEKGNYCIAGGDFNQNFPGIDPRRFVLKNSKYFVAGTLSPSLLAEGWQFASDKQIPSCRLLNEPYSGNPSDTQMYIIDGFIISPNVELVDLKAFDLDFKHSDHNPVKITVLLKQ